MKPLTNTLKTLITEHSIDILQQEQRLKAMLADLLPHDKQMRFLLELSLRAQIPQKLIAQQNETRLGWEAQIKSLKHYFKDEYFLEDKAVNSVFDCWVEVLPRKKQAAAPPKLGNLNAESKFKDIGAINWVRLAFAQNANWKGFFEALKITNYKSFFYDMVVVRHANHTSSYPKLVLPNSLQNAIAKQPPILFDYDSLSEKKSMSSFLFSNISTEDMALMTKLSKENRKNELSQIITKSGFRRYNELNKEIEKLKEESETIQKINADHTKTFNTEEFFKIGSLIGSNFSVPKPPKPPRIPKKENLPVDSNKEDKVSKEGLKNFLIALVLTALGLLFIYVWKYIMPIGGAYVLLFWPAIVFIPIGFVSLLYVFFIIYKLLVKLLTITKAKKKKLLVIQERKRLEVKNEREYHEDLVFYNNELLPQYEKEYKTYETKRNQQVKDLNDAFPLIVRQIWLQAMVTSSNAFSYGNTSNPVTSVKKFIIRLSLLFAKYLKANMKVFDIQSEIILNIDNKICINIEIDEPYNRETRQETHFVGSNDEKRDNVFAENNWFVLRFTESQVNYALAECISIVQELVQFTQNGNTQHLIKLNELSRSIEVLCWTKEEARLMAMNED
jgi:hypothetical protein